MPKSCVRASLEAKDTWVLAPTDSGKTYAGIPEIIGRVMCSDRVAAGTLIETACPWKVWRCNEEEMSETIVRIHRDDTAEVK